MIHVPSAFYVFTGAVLVLSGLTQIVLRARAEGKAGFFRPGAFFSLLSVALGVLVVYFGLFVHR
jgi:hypothetical protein